MRGLNAYLPDAGWRGPGAPFGEPWGQGLGALASYVRDAQWKGPGAPFGLGQDPTITGTPDYIPYSDLVAAAGPAGPDATNSVSGFFQSLIGQANSGAATLPTGQQAAAAFSVPSWVWIAGAAGLGLMLFGGRGRR